MKKTYPKTYFIKCVTQGVFFSLDNHILPKDVTRHIPVLPFCHLEIKF
jgi:hypothetical protein